MEFWLLAKIGFYFNIAEKVAYGFLAVYGARVGSRYYQDYKNSVEEEKIFDK